MKKLFILILIFWSATIAFTQNLLIGFEGSGAANTIDSIEVQNLTQGTTAKLFSGDTLQLVAITGINDFQDNNQKLDVYPNPMLDRAELSFFSQQAGTSEIEVFNNAGKKILHRKERVSQGIQKYRLTGLKQGVYIIKITANNCSYAGKLVSQSTSEGKSNIDYIGSTIQKMCSYKVKSATSTVNMEYTPGDRLLYKGFSGTCSTVTTDIPTSSKTIIFLFAFCTDYNSNNYSIVQIGSQVWMAENLKSTHYTDGTTIQYYCYNNDPGNVPVYGRLYNWAAAMNGAPSSNSNPSNVQGIAPTGWHLPSKAEWIQLAGYLEGLNIAGGKLKETGTARWVSPNTGATNQCGFAALPAGMHDFSGIFQWFGDHCAFSSSTGNLSQLEVTAIMLETTSAKMTVGGFHPDDAVSVRCVKNY